MRCLSNHLRSALPIALVIGLLGVQPVFAAGPVGVPIHEAFVDVNPCTGELHTVTVTGTFLEFHRGNGLAYRIDRTVQTSSGFAGGGTELGIGNDRSWKVTDLLANEAGDRILANAHLVADQSGQIRVDRIEVTCL